MEASSIVIPFFTTPYIAFISFLFVLLLALVLFLLLLFIFDIQLVQVITSLQLICSHWIQQFYILFAFIPRIINSNVGNSVIIKVKNLVLYIWLTLVVCRLYLEELQEIIRVWCIKVCNIYWRINNLIIFF